MTEGGSARGEYVLGANDRELARLSLQQEVWGGLTEAFLDRLALGEGARVLDLGTGPGLLLDSLARRVGATGRVDALDPSPTWRAHVERKIASSGWTRVRFLPCRVEDAPLDPGGYDLVLARWVLSFLPDVEGVVARLARALAPGGTLAVEDYNHEGISLFPRSEGFAAVVRATRALYATKGGDIWVAGRLPAAFRAAGLVLVDWRTHVLSGGPSSPAFRWADAFFPVFSDTMVAQGLMSAAERALFLSDWAARSSNPDALFFSPILVDAAARRPR